MNDRHPHNPNLRAIWLALLLMLAACNTPATTGKGDPEVIKGVTAEDPFGQDTAPSTVNEETRKQAEYDQSSIDGKVRAPPTLRPLGGALRTLADPLWTGSRVVSRLPSTFDEPVGIAVDAQAGVIAVGNDRETRVPNRTISTFITRLKPDGSLDWTSTFTSGSEDNATAVTVDANGNAYMVGYTYGDLSGIPNAGDRDAFVAKFDPQGNRLWVRLIGTDGHDGATSVTTDANGNAFVTGYTNRDLYGAPNAGQWDQFIAKFGPDGEGLWSRLHGSSDNQTAGGIAVVGNALYISGGSESPLRGEANAGNEDAFVVKYDLEGNRIWTKLFGTPKYDRATHLVVDNQNVYIAGFSNGNLRDETNPRGVGGNANAFVARVDGNGEILWSKLLPVLAYTPYNGGNPLARPGPVFVAGLAAHNDQVYLLPLEDGFFNWNPVVQFDSTGQLVRTSQFVRTDGQLNPLQYEPVVGGLAANATGVFLGFHKNYYDVDQPDQDSVVVERLSLDLIKR